MMKKYLWFILLILPFEAIAQAQTGLSSDQSRSFAKCLMVSQCWETGRHPNFFELNRFAPALKQFLGPDDYQLWVNNKDVTLALFTEDNRMDVAVGFCPPQPKDQNFSLGDCDQRTLIVSFSWDWPVSAILEAYDKNPQDDLPFDTVSEGILGANGQGGKLQILYIHPPEEVAYWQEGMVGKATLITNLDLFKDVQDACGKAPTDGPAECMQALAKAVSLAK